MLPDEEFADLVADHPVVVGGAREAATAYLGRPVEAEVDVRLPGRLEVRGDEVRDGAHTPAAAAWLLERLPEPRGYVVVASILDDKDAAGILARPRAGRRHPGRDTLVERPRAPRRPQSPSSGKERSRPRSRSTTRTRRSLTLVASGGPCS